MKKIMLLVAFAIGFGATADAQIGKAIRKGVGKAVEKATNKAAEKVTGKVNSTTTQAVEEATERAGISRKSSSDDDLEALLGEADATSGTSMTNKQLATELKKGKNEPHIDANSSGAEISRALGYWLDLTEYAVQQKDEEWLCSEKADNTYDLIMMLRQRKADGKTDGYFYDKDKPRYDEVTAKVSKLLLAGAPEKDKPLSGNDYLVASIKWYIDKADKGGANAKRYMIVKAADMRRRAFESGRYNDTPEVKQVTEELKTRWAKFDESYKTKNAIDDPNLTYDQIVAAKKQKDAQEKAERQAKINAAKQTLKAGGLNASLNAQILKVARQRMPETIKVVVENDAWSYKKNGIVIEYRFVSAWVVSKDKDGNLIAHDYTFAQDYKGGGKYGAMRYNGIGLRTVYVK